MASWENHFGRRGYCKLFGEAKKNESGDDIEGFEKWVNSWFKNTDNAIQGL